MFIEIKSHVAHSFHGWTISHNTAILFCIKMENNDSDKHYLFVVIHSLNCK